MRRRTLLVLAAIVTLLVVAGSVAIARRPFPPDTAPEGAYARIALAIAERRPRDSFAYLETEAQWACFTIHELRKRASDRVRAAYPPAEQARLLDAWREEAEAPDGPDVFVVMAKRNVPLPEFGVRNM